MKIIFTDRRHLLALICVLTIFASTCALWWFILVGGNPYHPGGLRIYNRDGIETYQFKQGDWVVLRRQYVSIARSSPNSYQRFTTRQDALVLLPGSAVVAARGCSVRSSMFQIPLTLAPGPYEYRNVSRFQNNLVGRDEANSYPPMKKKGYCRE